MVAGFGVDVFICHRGPDTQLSFVRDMLSHEFRDRSVYVDTWALPPGEPDWPTLSRNLSDASIVLVVLSPRFQESAWCLEELCAAIKQGRLDKTTGAEWKTLRVVCFGKDSAKVDEDQMASALVELKDSAKQMPQLQNIASLGDAAILQRWRSALRKAGAVVHWQFNGSGSHQDLPAEIAQDIERALPPLPRDPSGMKIGIQRTVNQLLDLPEMQKASGVCLLGMAGMGGIGETTLATALVDRLSSNFLSNYVCFVADVRSRAGVIEEIQHQVLKQLSPIDAGRLGRLGRPHNKAEDTY